MVNHWGMGHPWWLSSKESTCQCRRCGFNPWFWKIPWSRKWQPTPVFLPGESHGQRRLVGHSPWVAKSQTRLSDWTELKLLQSCLTLLRHYGLHPTSLLCPWDSPGKNTGVGCCFILQGIFPNRGSNLCLFMSPSLAGEFFTCSTSWEALIFPLGWLKCSFRSFCKMLQEIWMNFLANPI